MKKTTSKKDVRNNLNRDVEEYLRSGGEVKSFERGESGLVNGRYSEQAIAFEKRKERTPLPEVVKAIEERKESRKKSSSKKSTNKTGPKKKVIYDDFGDPIRVVWEE